ncbi:TetR family transcriptional regulator [uncultured Piscinibacter sp.]|uniref:TetR family transcriptional regulator n=1 Tax=uncultured Piscinibacter sp. TaxID=1131835 RepID=UPI0026118D18|nr:TetR family transcriptional regulator [uncultured Piscinibacter sp.]
MARRTKEDAQRTRDRILDMAEREFQRRGVSRTSLELVARAAGVTRGAVYWHFRNKADLFNAMMNRVTLPLESEILRSGLRTLDDPVAQIRGSFLAALRATVEDPQARRVFEIALFKVEHSNALRGVRERRLKGLRGRVENVERGFRRAARLGLWSGSVTPRVAALGMQSLIDGLISNWMIAPEAFDLVRVGEQAIDAYLRGVHAPAAG